jgi:hypothetical protein
MFKIESFLWIFLMKGNEILALHVTFSFHCNTSNLHLTSIFKIRSKLQFIYYYVLEYRTFILSMIKCTCQHNIKDL